MNRQNSFFDELFDAAMMQYAMWTLYRLNTLLAVFEKLDEKTQEKIKDNIKCEISDEEMKMFENIEEKIEKGDVNSVELATSVIAVFACLAHAFRAAGLGDIVDVVIQLTETPSTQK